MYCIIIWGTCSPLLFLDLEQIHIRAAKLIHNIKGEYLSNEKIFKRVNWRNLDHNSVNIGFYQTCTIFTMKNH